MIAIVMWSLFGSRRPLVLGDRTLQVRMPPEHRDVVLNDAFVRTRIELVHAFEELSSDRIDIAVN